MLGFWSRAWIWNCDYCYLNILPTYVMLFCIAVALVVCFGAWRITIPKYGSTRPQTPRSKTHYQSYGDAEEHHVCR